MSDKLDKAIDWLIKAKVDRGLNDYEKIQARNKRNVRVNMADEDDKPKIVGTPKKQKGVNFGHGNMTQMGKKFVKEVLHPAHMKEINKIKPKLVKAIEKAKELLKK